MDTGYTAWHTVTYCSFTDVYFLFFRFLVGLFVFVLLLGEEAETVEGRYGGMGTGVHHVNFTKNQ